MKETPQEKSAKKLRRNYKLAIAMIENVILPMEDKERIKNNLEAVIRENENNFEPHYKKYMEMEDRNPDLDSQVENLRKQLLSLIEIASDMGN